MDENLVKTQDVFLGKINQMCARFGLNNIMAQLYAVLYLSNRHLSLDDMVERLKISKGSVSVNIRALERYGVVRRVWVKGSRRDYYEAEADITKVVMDRIKSMAQGRLSEIDDMLNSSYQILNSVNPSDKEEKQAVQAFREKLDQLRSLHNRVQSIFKLFNSGLLNNMLGTKSKRNNKKKIPIEMAV